MKVSLKCTSRKYKFGEKPVQECNKVATKCEMPIFVFFFAIGPRSSALLRDFRDVDYLVLCFLT